MARNIRKEPKQVACIHLTGQEPVAVSCEQGNEPSGSEGESHQLSDYQHLKKGPAPCSHKLLVFLYEKSR
jgi:hypothetical protein